MSFFFEIKFQDIEFYEKCGSGACGSVFRALWKPQNLIVAVKKVLYFGSEADVLSHLSHRNIIQFYGAVNESPNHCLVTEFAVNGSLYDFLKLPLKSELDFKQTVEWAIQIGRGMNYLHAEAPVKIIHRDLKSKNGLDSLSIVIDGNMTCKICDFGTSRFVGGTTKMSLAGTCPWMSPEVIQSLPVSPACDVWSYGVVLWELLTHQEPFEGIEGFRVMWLVVENGERLSIPSTCPGKFEQLLQKCWRAEPKERPTFKEILTSLDDIFNDEKLVDEVETFFGDRAVWTAEIDAWLERVKAMERKLEIWERSLQDREVNIKERERKLEQQFRVVEIMSYDVNSWRDVDVRQWIVQLANDGYHNNDLIQFADLFVQNDINGRRLLMLSRDDLRQMGITSVGPVMELQKAIEELKAHNFRLQNFPPLNPAVASKTSPENFSCSVTVITGCHIRVGPTLQETKWKMYLEVDCDEDSPAGSEEDFSVLSLIKHVAFVSPHLPCTTVKLNQSPFIMDRWVTGVVDDMKVECIVTFEDRVRKPHSSRLAFVLCSRECINTIAPVEQRLQLIVARRSSPPATLASAATSSSNNRTNMKHSQSSPALRGVWSARNLQQSLQTVIDTSHYQESEWSEVVAGNKKPEYPAYNPKFPVPVPIMTPVGSSANGGGGVDGKMFSRHTSPLQLSATSSVQSRDSLLCDQDADELEDAIHIPPMRNSRTESDLLRGISADSGSVFASPSVRQSAQHPPLFSSSSDQSRGDLGQIRSLADISRRFFSHEDTEVSRNDLDVNESSLFYRRLSSPLTQTAAAALVAQESSPVDSDDVQSPMHSRSNSFRVRQKNKNSWTNIQGYGARPLNHSNSPAANHASVSNSDVATFTDSMSVGTGKLRKGKKGKGSQQVAIPSNGSSAGSCVVHGGNAKWAWR